MLKAGKSHKNLQKNKPMNVEHQIYVKFSLCALIFHTFLLLRERERVTKQTTPPN